jgi:hypothetical protein
VARDDAATDSSLHPAPAADAGDTMQFHETTEGDYRIFAGAIEAPARDGYLAALVVNRTAGERRSQREVYRDTSLAAGYAWPSADAALRYAVQRGQEIVRHRPALLAC